MDIKYKRLSIDDDVKSLLELIESNGDWSQVPQVPNNIIYVAIHDGKIIGTATLLIQRKMIRDFSNAGFIEDVIVHRDYRGQKIGTNLVRILIDEAKKANCYKIVLSCKKETTEFYKKMGFEELETTMKLYLS